MQQLSRIPAIKGRSEKIGLSLIQLCTAAGIPPSTVYRWHSGETEPRLHHFDKVCAALEAELARREQEILRHLRSLPGAAA